MRAGVILALAAAACYDPHLEPAAASPCGDGSRDDGEDCDDGDDDPTDLCVTPTTCRLARCGDGEVRAGLEDCDDGGVQGGDGCTAICVRCTGPADDVHETDDGGCVLRHDGSATWGAAATACAQAGERLAVFDGPAENDEAAARLIVPTWIGLEYDETRGWTWVNGETPTFNHWAGTEPSCSPCTTSHHVVLHPGTGEWTIADGATTHPYLCDRGPTWAVAADGHAYRFTPNPSSWEVAQATCQALASGGHLATVSSVTEQDYLAPRLPNADVWIGGSDRSVEGRFDWVTGERWDYANWSTGNPDGAEGMDCVVQSGAFSGAWDDVDCAVARVGLCEAD